MKLYIFQYGFVLDNKTKIPVSGFLIKTDDGKNILIDTGFRREDPFSNNLLAEKDDRVENRLVSIGLKPEDIDYLICTHLDPDHCGYHDLFLNSSIVIQKKHYELAKSGKSQRLEIYRKYWDMPQLKYELVEGDLELVPGVTLLDTTGHMEGHQSVLVKLPTFGSVIITGDAVFHEHEYLSETPNELDKEKGNKLNSIRKIKDIEETNEVKLIVFGHDPEQWNVLKKSPEFYE